MSCTTILVGKNASHDGSVMMARNDDSGSGKYDPKRMVVVRPFEQPRVYRSVLSHFEKKLPARPMAYTAVPNAGLKEGIWAAGGINAANVAMTATETISNNERVLGADPLVIYREADGSRPEVIGGISEEDMVTMVLPYIHTAREGVLRLGALLEELGTSEMNGIGFADRDECWWMETVGGHHWIARRVDDDAVVVMPNQLGIDTFDLADALGKGKKYLCSADLLTFMQTHHLDLTPGEALTAETKKRHTFNPRDAFGTRDDSDHVYNTPRAWYLLRALSGDSSLFDGEQASFRPEDDDLPWQIVPPRKVTPEEVKVLLSSHFQGTPYDPYATYGDPARRGMYRSIGINRTDQYSCLQLRGNLGEDLAGLHWIAFASNAFNVSVPMYAHVEKMPAYLADTTESITTDSLYWASRMIGALSDASYGKCLNRIERYAAEVGAQARAIIARTDAAVQAPATGRGSAKGGRRAASARKLMEEANEEIAAMLRRETDRTLTDVLAARCNDMKNGYARSDH